MRFKIDKRTFVQAVRTAVKAVSVKPQVPILAGLLIEATDDKVTVTGNGVSTIIQATAQASVEEEGSTVVDAKILDNIIRRLPEGDVSFVQDDATTAELSSQNSKLKIVCELPDEFPAVAALDNVHSVTVPNDILCAILNKTIPFASTDETKNRMFSGLKFEIDTNTLRVVSSDSHRIAYVVKEIDYTGEPFNMIIPVSSMLKCFNLRSAFEGNVQISTDERTVSFKYPTYEMFISLMDGEYLNYKPIINAEESTTTIEVEKQYMQSVINRAVLISDSEFVPANKPPFIFNINDKKVETTCSAGRGTVRDELRATVSGKNLRIGGNAKFLGDIINACEGENIKIEMRTPTSGIFVHENDAVYMMMPMRLFG